MNLWPHQERALKEIHDSLFNEKRICVTAPTGAGKSLMMRCLLEWCVENQLRAVLYTNRKLLREQLSAGLNAAGIDHGVRAAGHALDCWQGIQVSSIQTEDRRVFKTGAWELHDANIVLVDEAHMHKSGVSVKIIDAHVADGATVIGWSVGGDSSILMSIGDKIERMTLESAWNKYSSDAKVTNGIEVASILGSKVRSFDGERFVWSNAESIMRHRLTGKKAYEITTEKGRSITVTEDHSVHRLSFNGKDSKSRKPFSSLEVCKGSDLSIGDYLVLDSVIDSVPCENTSSINMTSLTSDKRYIVYGDFDSDVSQLPIAQWKKDSREGKYGTYLRQKEFAKTRSQTGLARFVHGQSNLFPVSLDVSDFAYILGYYLGDGWTDGGRVNFAVANKDIDSFKKQLEKLSGVFEGSTFSIKEMSGESVEVRWPCKSLASVLRNICGTHAHNKRIPEQCFSFSKEHIKILLQGMLDSDGHLGLHNRSLRYTYVTVSSELAWGLVDLLRLIGVSASVQTALPRQGGIIGGRRITGKRIKYSVSFSKTAVDGELCARRGRSFIQDFDGFPVKIKGIKEVFPEYVYDICVPETNTFVASGFLVHNSATPLELGHVYKRLISAGKNSELRKCGAHVPCLTYAPDEPDLRNIGPVKVGEDLTESQNVKAIMRPGIFGRVYKHWCEINKDARPTILFGPDVGGSLYFAEQFHNKGVSAAHIDAKYVWINGQQYPTTQELRDEVIAGVKCGDIKVICNRFVLREGIDIPELYCGILASVFGSLSTYLQASGRLLRSHKSLDQVVLIDHGGNYWRHGSVNADREWHLSDTNRILAERRMEALREKKEAEPITCPQCSKVRASGPKCPECGFQHQKKSRMVVQASGKLVPRYGDIVKPRVTEKRNDTEEKWKQMYHRAKRSKNGMTFKQAWGLFYKENGYFPPRNLPEMPKDELSWSRKVRDVRYVELNASLNDPVIG
jgi:superfamily II DNA or RNA helicase/intein/homing endonuclease